MSGLGSFLAMLCVNGVGEVLFVRVIILLVRPFFWGIRRDGRGGDWQIRQVHNEVGADF